MSNVLFLLFCDGIQETLEGNWTSTHSAETKIEYPSQTEITMKFKIKLICVPWRVHEIFWNFKSLKLWAIDCCVRHSREIEPPTAAAETKIEYHPSQIEIKMKFLI